MSKRSTDWDLYHNFLLLVVNSDPEESEHLKVRFEDEGFKVILAESFDRCMDILEGESVDVLVTDFNVDGIEGKELVSSIKRKYPSVPVIVTGGDLSEENITALIDCNVFGLFCVKNQLEQLAAQSTKAVEKQAKQIGKKMF